MKKSVLFLTGILSAGIILSACGDRQTGGQRQENTATEDNAASDESNVSDKTDASGDTEGNDNEETPVLNDPPETPPITIMDLSEEEVREELAQYPNFKVSDDLYINVPKEAQVLRYTAFIPPVTLEDTREYVKGFQEMYDYIFPNHPMDEDYLYYVGGSSDTKYDDDGNLLQDYNKVKDFKDKILSGEEGGGGSVYFIYDETWNKQLEKLDSEICFMLPNQTGYGNGVLNKGKTLKLSGYKTEEGFCPSLYSFWPCDYLNELVGSYQPDSRASFKLADKETPICEAAAFAEQYINGLPYPKEKKAKTSIVGVDVYKVNKDTYGYHFLTTKNYRGIPYDHMRSGASFSRVTKYSQTGGYAFMVESNDIDAFYGYYQTESVTEYEICDKIIPFEEAAKIISEKLSDKPGFDVLNIEFVYLDEPKKDKKGRYDIVNYISWMKPAWKFTLYNPNDEYYYACFLDAADTADEAEFTYYTTPGDLGFQK